MKAKDNLARDKSRSNSERKLALGSAERKRKLSGAFQEEEEVPSPTLNVKRLVIEKTDVEENSSLRIVHANDSRSK